MADVQKKSAPAAEGAAKTPGKTVMKKKSASTVDSEEKQPLSTKDGASPPKMKKIVKRSSGDNVKKAADGATPKKVVKKPSSVAGESEASSTKAKKTVKKASDSEATPKAKKPVDKEPVEKGIDTPKKKVTDGAKKATDSAKKAAPSTPKKAPAPAEEASQADNEDQNDEDVFEDSVEESGNDAAEETNAAETEANGLKRVDSGKDLADGVDGVDGEDTERAGSEQDEDEDSEDDPFKEFKEGLRSKDQQDSRPQDDSDMQELPPLSEEEMAKLTPGKDFDISKYQTKEKAEDAAEGVTDEVEGAKDDAEDKADDAVDEAEDAAKEGEDAAEDAAEEGKDKLADVTEEPEEAGEEAGDKLDDATKEGEDKLDDAAKEGEDKLDDATKEADDKVDDAAKEGESKLDDATKEGEDKLPEDVEAPEATEDVAKEGEDALKEGEEAAGDAAKEGEEKLDDATKEGEEKLDDAAKEGEEAKEGVEDELEEGEIDIHNLTLASLKGGKVNKGGNVMVDGKPLGRITEGVLKHLVGKSVDKEGNIWNDSGKKIGKAELIPEDELEELLKEPSPFEAFPDATINGEGYAIFEGERVGKLVEGDAKKLRGMKIDADGDVLSKYGETLGKVERWEPEEEPEPEAEPEIDLSALSGKRVNKAGNLVDSDGKLFGRVVAGDVKKMIGRMCDKDGIIRSESGEELGRGELIPDDEREAMSKESAPFESFPDAKVDGEGYVVFEGEKVGKVTEGDLKRLRGMTVDQDGDILDRSGNVVGKAERWEPEAEPEPEEIDTSILAGKRVNKAGNVVDSSGVIYGRVVEGDAKRLVGRMCNKKGEILSESGDVLGRAELVPEGDREGFKDGPFTELENCTVAKDGTVVTASGDIVGRLVEGDGKKLFGRAVDEDGDVVDRNGNVLGKAERWEPEPEPEKKKGPLAGRRVNKEGGVVDEDGNLIGKLTSGDLSICAGKEIDDDGDVVDGKGTTVGHCSLIGDIKEPEEKPEDKEKREKAEQDKKLAQQMSYCLTQVLDKIKPICQMITSKIEKADATPKEDLDEEELVKEVRPLIEEGGKILQEANGIIRGLDPDGRIQANAKHRTATREATPEEYRLADILKELTGTVTKTIEDAKKKLEGMPHAKKELNPLWGLLNEPLFQILAAVGMLLSGVLGLVGRLLNGLGLGGIVDGLLGGLGIKNILGALGVGSLADSLTGKDQKGGKKKKGGLLGLGG